MATFFALVISFLIRSAACPLIASKGEGRRLVQQGGVSVDDVKVTDIAKTCTAADFEKGHVIIKKGKKVFHKVVLK